MQTEEHFKWPSMFSARMRYVNWNQTKVLFTSVLFMRLYQKDSQSLKIKKSLTI